MVVGSRGVYCLERIEDKNRLRNVTPQISADDGHTHVKNEYRLK